MTYITVKEASERWNISTRRVCVLCSKGQIPGAVKKSKVWMIPHDAQKPQDGRKVSAPEEIEPIALLFNPHYFKERSGRIPNEDELRICTIQEAFFEGRLEEAYEETNRWIHETENNRCLFVGGILMCLICADLGKKEELSNSMRLLSQLTKTQDKYLYERQIYQLYFGSVDKNTVFRIPERHYEELMPIVCYINAKKGINSIIRSNNISDIVNYEILCKEIEEKNSPLLLAYYHIILAVFYNAMGSMENYRYHIDGALDILLPEKWYTPIAEYSGTLDLHFIKEMDEQAYRAITDLSDKIIKNYVEAGIFAQIVDIPEVNRSVMIQIALKITQGVDQREIADALHISQYKLKQYVDSLYLALGVNNKRELKEYVMKNFFV